jgi:hypothetical protein
LLVFFRRSFLGVHFFSWQLSVWFLSSAFGLLVLLWSLSIPLLLKHCYSFFLPFISIYLLVFLFLFFSLSLRFVSRADYSQFDFYSSSALEVLVLLWFLSIPLLSFSSCEAISLIVLFFSVYASLRAWRLSVRFLFFC